MPSTDIKLNGINNRTRPGSVPEGKAKNAVNTLFDKSGNIVMPRFGKTVLYAGDVTSLAECDTGTFFVENGDLKILNADGTASVLKSNVGIDRVSFTKPVGDEVFFSNATSSGRIKNGSVASPWGTPRPTRQPTCTPTSFGGMYAGDYRVAITWIAEDESGTGMGRRVTVPASGGIYLSDLPTPPAFVTAIGVYVSSVNGEEMWFYGDYPASTTAITLSRKICTIPLRTQFMYPPQPMGLVLLHFGRIHYPRGTRLYRTEPHKYGLQKANSYVQFDSEIQTVVSCPGVIYVGTLGMIYGLKNIDGDGPIRVEELQDAGSVKGTECYDPDGVSAYFVCNRGFIKATPEGLEELTYADCALPFFKTGATTVVEYNGSKYLVGTFQDGEQNPLADKEYLAAQLLRNSL